MLKGLELKVFLSICRAVRNEQDRRIDYNKFSMEASGEIFYKSTNMYIWVEANTVNWGVAGVNTGQVFAILYKLQEQGYIKYHAGGWKKKSKVQLDKKGIELIKELKKQVKK